MKKNFSNRLNFNTRKTCEQPHQLSLFDPPPIDYPSCPLGFCLSLLKAEKLKGWERFFVGQKADLLGEELSAWEADRLQEIASKHASRTGLPPPE